MLCSPEALYLTPWPLVASDLQNLKSATTSKLTEAKVATQAAATKGSLPLPVIGAVVVAVFAVLAFLLIK